MTAMAQPGVLRLVVSICFTFSAIMAASTTGTTPTGDVTLIATPTSMHQDLTPDLSLNCSLQRQQDSDFKTLLSIILSKAGSDGKFTEIAAVSSVSPDVTVKESLNASVTGKLTNSGQSFISYQWRYPGELVTGDYHCEARGMDAFGHIQVSTGTTTIARQEVDSDVILGRVRQIESDFNARLQDKQAQLDQVLTMLDDKQTQLDNQAVQLTDQKSQIDDQKNQIGQQKSQLNDVINRLENSRDAIIEFSTSFRGHHYLLSRPMWRTVAVYDSLCRLYGGSLLEIDDVQEFDFVNSFLQSKSDVSGQIFVSGTDEVRDTHWKHQESGNRVMYFNWADNDPDDRDGEDCIVINSSHNWKMSDYQCNEKLWNRFLCEVS